MNQGKLEVIKQEMARVNINILEISELKWTGMGDKEQDHPQEKENLFWVSVLEGFVGLHRTVQLQLLQHS